MRNVVSFAVFAGVVFIGRVESHEELHAQIERATQLIAKSPRDARVYQRRGVLYGEHGEWRRALADFVRAASLAPASSQVAPDTHALRAHALRELGHAAAALAIVDASLVRFPEHGALLMERARTLSALARHAAAADAFARAFPHLSTIRPADYLARARALARAGDLIAAVRSLDDAMAKSGMIASLRDYALELEISGARHDAALKRIDGALASARRKETWFVRRGDVLLAAGRRTKARASYRRARAAINALPARHRRAPAIKTLRQAIVRGLRSAAGEQLDD